MNIIYINQSDVECMYACICLVLESPSGKCDSSSLKSSENRNNWSNKLISNHFTNTRKYLKKKNKKSVQRFLGAVLGPRVLSHSITPRGLSQKILKKVMKLFFQHVSKPLASYWTDCCEKRNERKKTTTWQKTECDCEMTVFDLFSSNPSGVATEQID